jgi:hypothetical protein
MGLEMRMLMVSERNQKHVLNHRNIRQLPLELPFPLLLSSLSQLQRVSQLQSSQLVCQPLLTQLVHYQS